MGQTSKLLGELKEMGGIGVTYKKTQERHKDVDGKIHPSVWEYEQYGGHLLDVEKRSLFRGTSVNMYDMPFCLRAKKIIYPFLSKAGKKRLDEYEKQIDQERREREAEQEKSQ